MIAFTAAWGSGPLKKIWSCPGLEVKCFRDGHGTATAGDTETAPAWSIDDPKATVQSPVPRGGRSVIERGMTASRVVPTFDEVESRDAGIGLGPETVTIQQLALEGGEETLAHRVVVGVADTAHRLPDVGFTTATAEASPVSCHP